jgi:hypothetical protein
LALEDFERFVEGFSLEPLCKSLPRNSLAFCRKFQNTLGGDIKGPLSSLALRVDPGIS